VIYGLGTLILGSSVSIPALKDLENGIE
jgi:hypothetical protein